MVIISPVTPWYSFFTFGLITHLGEELGWRGWLQDHLKIESPIKKSFAISVMWELWHFTNRTTQGPLLIIIIRVFAFIIFCSFFS
jgi:membrane protease YdiL (CAAX protease family)